MHEALSASELLQIKILIILFRVHCHKNQIHEFYLLQHKLCYASLKTVVEQCLVDAAVNLLKHVLQVFACQHDQHIEALQLYIAETCSRSFQPGT